MSDATPDLPPDASPAPKKRLMADLGPRVASGLVMIGLALGTLYYGGHAFNLFWLAAGLAVNWEWQRLVGGNQPRLRFLLGSLALVLAAGLATQGGADLAVAVIAAAALGLAYLAGEDRRIWAGSGIVYAGALVISVVTLRHDPIFGLKAILWLFAIVWGTDIMAYFGGRLIGGPKFWPRVSPSKTWSGTLTGVISGGIFGLLVARSALEPSAYLAMFALSLFTACISQAGDFFESSIKRHFGVKDSSNLIPGHGGFMDRLDGFIVAAAFAALFGALRGLPSVASGLFHWL